MSRHEVYSQDHPIEEGFETYSILLIPKYEWFDEETGLKGAFDFFRRFKAFGDILGEDHLACWFYHNMGASHRQVDFYVSAAIGDNFSNVNEVDHDTWSKTLGRYQQPPYPASEGEYDVQRARIVCTALGLPYSRGPYIAFFTSCPELPSCKTNQNRQRVRVRVDEVTKPSFVLQFGGLGKEKALELLDDLEQRLLSGDLEVGKLRWKQVWLRIEAWCAEHRETFVTVIKAAASVVAK